jgi:hypothetical protein
MGCTEAALGASQICQPFVALYIATKFQSIRKDAIGLFLSFSCYQTLRLLQLESQRKTGVRWPTIRPCPSFRGPGRPLRQIRESASLLIFHPPRGGQMEEKPVEDLRFWPCFLLRTCDAVLTGPALHCTSFTPAVDLWVGLHRGAPRRNLSVRLLGRSTIFNHNQSHFHQN